MRTGRAIYMKDKTIWYLRKKAGFKQAELSAILGLTVTEMSFIENKKVYPDTLTVSKISEVLKTPVGLIWTEGELNLILERENK